MQIPKFEETVSNKSISLNRNQLEILQINVGRLCNQACHHCHVEAGPKRTELMNWKDASRVIELMRATSTLKTFDITGGAPEMNPYFKSLAVAGRECGLEVIDRCNLTIFYEVGFEDTPEFLANNQITVIASLPCYSKENVDSQRGSGVFDLSIRALQRLNELGYAKKGSNLKLHLVYNPLGTDLPPPQAELEASYKDRLLEDFNIEFNELFTITNMPIRRFLFMLQRKGLYEEYMESLLTNFNPHAANNIMCKNLVSIGWEGTIYDCDFNQMLELPVGGKDLTIWDIENLSQIEQSAISFGPHCYGCTAGSGSSCTGTLT